MHAAGLRLPRVAAGVGFPFCNEPESLVNNNTTTLDTPPILSLHVATASTSLNSSGVESRLSRMRARLADWAGCE